MAGNEFRDTARITIKSGDGGDGMCSFMSFKGKPACGPDGGDGGRGGDVYMVADENLGDLTSFIHRTKFAAGNGGRGGSSQCTGADGEDVEVRVPVGTVVRDCETGSVIADMFENGERKLICEGGRGGKGNSRFCTSRRHAPHFAQRGEKTEPHAVELELKVIADVGTIGFPNVGKSTLLSKISAARPRIADYHFTTLSPNLGVVHFYDDTFVAADIPGLIEGASDGAGLGHDFLRHIERTRMLLHVVDVSGVEGRDPIDDFGKINAELAAYSEKLASLPQIVVLNKCDIYGAGENVSAFRERYGGEYEIYELTAVSGSGADAMLSGIVRMLSTLPPVSRDRVDEEFTYRKSGPLSFEIYTDEDAYVVTGSLVDMLCRTVNLDDSDSAAYFQKVLRDKGVVDRLIEMGIKDGDTVVIGDIEFEFLN